MIVEPVPTNPPSPLRRGLRLAGMVVPVALLAGVVAAGALGSQPDPEDRAAPSDAARAQASIPTTAPDAAAMRTAFPVSFAGLPVRTVTATLDGRRSGRLAGLVVVSGYLTIPDLPPACGDRYLGPFGPFCERRAILADTSTNPIGADRGSIGPHLHPQIPVGVRVPQQVARNSAEVVAPEPIPVVVVGRFDDPRATPCAPDSRDCDEALVVERVAWADGEDYPRTTTIDPALDVDLGDEHWQERRSAARAALGWDKALLQTAYLTPAMLERVDPDAAVALHAAPGPVPAAVWYVRGLEVVEPGGGATPDVSPPAIHWVVLDGWTETPIVTSEGLPPRADAVMPAEGQGYPN